MGLAAMDTESFLDVVLDLDIDIFVLSFCQYLRKCIYKFNVYYLEKRR